MLNLLIIDDSIPFLRDMEIMMQDKYNIVKAETGTKGLNILHKENFSAVLLDLKLPDINGIEILKKIHLEIDPFLPVIIVTDYANVDVAVEAMKFGASDFIPKDFNIKMLSQRILKALEKRDMAKNIIALKENLDNKTDKFVFKSDVMQIVDDEINKLAVQDCNVLIIGETGVGKDLAASEIHKRSKRKDKAFIQVSIGSLSESTIESELFGHEKGAFTGADNLKIGKFEAADSGIIYLPEISSINQNIQNKLLKFMQYKTICRLGQDARKKELNLNVRVLMATNDNLNRFVEDGKMREDFFYRITGVTLYIPPLRERKEDIEPLANYFLKKISVEYDKPDEYKLSPEVIRFFENHDWRGNVRELSNFIESAVVKSSKTTLTIDDFSRKDPPHNYTFQNVMNKPGNNNSYNFKEAEQNFKKEYFSKLIKESGGNITRAAEIAGITRQTLHLIIKELGIY